MSATAERALRIGELASAAGTTARTIRYYEEIGLLPEAGERPAGRHRVYTAEDLERLRQIMRLRDLLGVSLDELKDLVEYEVSRPSIIAELESGADAQRQREILDRALGHINRQLELVRARAAELQGLEDELLERRRRAKARLRSL
jgi:DNA-binding transcriptional MerR regulator